MANASIPVRQIGKARIATLRKGEALKLVHQALASGDSTVFGYCNAHTVNVARRNGEFAQALTSMTLLPDGIGVDIASKLLYGEAFPENLNGTDLTPELLATAPRPLSVFLLGSPPGVVEIAADRIQERYSGVRVVGHHHGYFADDESPKIVQFIKNSGAHLTLVGMGHPRQEIWAANHGLQTGTVVVTVGALFDFIVGRVPRAPLWVRKARSEWLFRLAMEPTRLARRYIIGNFMFLAFVVRLRFRSDGGA